MTLYAAVKILCIDQADEKCDFVGSVTIPLKDIHHGATKEVVEKWYPLQPITDKDQKQKLSRQIVYAKKKMLGGSESASEGLIQRVSFIFSFAYYSLFLSYPTLFDLK